MDTKLKSFHDNMLVRTLAFLLCAGLLVGSLYSIFMAGNTVDKVQQASRSGMDYIYAEDLFFAEQFTESESYYGNFYNYADQIIAFLNVQRNYNENEYVSEDVEYIRGIKDQLESIKGFFYYATDGKNVITNLDLEGDSESASDGGALTDLAAVFTEKPTYLIYSAKKLQQEPSIPLQFRNSYFNEDNTSRMLRESFGDWGEGAALYMAYDQNYLDEHSEMFSMASSQLRKWITTAATTALACIVVLIYLLVTTGRKGPDGKRKNYHWDGIPTEIQLILLAVAAVLGVGSCFVAMEGMYFGGVGLLGMILESQYQMMGIFGLVLCCALAACMGLWFLLSCVRNLKAHRFIKNSIIYKIIAAIGGSILQVYRGGSVMQKVVLMALAICLLSATVALAPVVFIAILVFAPRWVNDYQEIQKGVDEVKNGNLNYKIPVRREGEFAQLARGINEISEASSIAVQNELRNQKMKTELISNVSHDLKTPLTSIITYVDLLKTAGLNCEDAPKYLDVLDQKSRRLQKLTEDLFDAAKASSGAMPVRFEKVELMALIQQAMGEMADAIANSKLEFRINAAKEKYYVLSDGQLTWRVVENLLGNVLKYAQPGSRVYIDLREPKSDNGNGKSPAIILEIKNISKAELNITADELTERFTRGDESRTAEGSGLGLAIAKDLVKLQNGWFEVQIDGDLFKARVMLNAYTEGERQAEEREGAEAAEGTIEK